MVIVQSGDTHLLFKDPAIKWVWRPDELERFRNMWNEGDDIQTIAKTFRVNKMTIVLLIMDQADAGEIKQRKNGLFGN